MKALQLILWIDDRTCAVCEYGQLAVLGPAYGQSSDYVLTCIHCRAEQQPEIGIATGP